MNVLLFIRTTIKENKPKLIPIKSKSSKPLLRQIRYKIRIKNDKISCMDNIYDLLLIR